jgi:hypothetical protein
MSYAHLPFLFEKAQNQAKTPHEQASDYHCWLFYCLRKKGSDMASFHFEIKSGRSADDHADYIVRQGFHSKREDLVASGHGNLPEWANESPKTLWKAAYREAIIALPTELTIEQNNALVDDLLSMLALGKPFQFAIHAPSSSLESESNPHVHLMTSDRMDDGIERSAERFFSRYNAKQPEKGGCKKSSGGRNRMQIRDDVIATRRLVADTINHHLAISGHDARVDHRTLKAQGIEREAERHLGPARIRGMSAQKKAEYLAVRCNARKESS